MDAVKVYQYIINNASDPRVNQWKFMGSPWPTLYVIGTYLLLVLLLLPAYMRNRKPFNLTKIIRLYNISQVAACCTIIYMLASAGWLTGDYSFGCQPIDYSYNPKALKVVNVFWWLYILKMVELVETIFFVLRKKNNQVSGLHIYHHASSLFIAYIACKFMGGGMFAIPVILNCLIHVMMYTYYYLSSLGPEWQKRLASWKPKLTIAQMIQFTLMIIHSMTAFLPGCSVPKPFFAIYLPNLFVLYKMFYDFYQKSYRRKQVKTN